MPLPPATPDTPAEECAYRLLETAPMVMRLIRREMQGTAEENLSVPQFRVLAFLQRHPGASLSQVSEHLGVAAATASTMVERLVRRGFVHREVHPVERRRIVLVLTAEGGELLARALARARVVLADSLAALDEARLRRLSGDLELLHRTLEPLALREATPDHGLA